MQRTNIYLDEDQLRMLKHLAVEEHQSVADLVRRAVDAYLAQRIADNRAWREQLDHLIERIHSRLPATISSREIEADVTAAPQEV